MAATALSKTEEIGGGTLLGSEGILPALFERPACGIGRRRIGYDGSERGNNFIGKRFLGHCRRHSFHFHDDARCHNRRIYFTRLAFDLGEGNMSGTAGNQEASAFIGCILKGLMSQARIPKAFWFASAIR